MPVSRKWQHRAYVAVLLAVFGVIAFGVIWNVVLAQRASAYSDWAINELSRRITIVEAQQLDGRLRVVESDMAEVKYLTRAVVIAVIGQLAVGGIGMLRRRGQN